MLFGEGELDVHVVAGGCHAGAAVIALAILRQLGAAAEGAIHAVAKAATGHFPVAHGGGLARGLGAGFAGGAGAISQAHVDLGNQPIRLAPRPSPTLLNFTFAQYARSTRVAS